MKRLILMAAVLPFFASAETLYQCAVAKVVPDGARVNVIESDGKVRINLIFGTTVSGTMYGVSETDFGYAGEIRNQPDYTIELAITDETAENANVRGFRSFLKAVYPTTQTAAGFDVIETELVCGEKIADRWK